MVELMVAVLILSIAVIGLFRVFNETVHSTTAMRDRVLSQIVVENRVAMISLGQDSLPDRVTLGGYDWQVDTIYIATSGGFAEVRVTATPVVGGAGAQLTTYATQGDP